MNFLHTQLNLTPQQVVHVTLTGNSANVLLLDDENYSRYRLGEGYEHLAGGYYTHSPAVLRAPAEGRWHLVVDLAGAGGQVSAGVTVHQD